MIATLTWFDATSGEGMVTVGAESLYLHFTCIDGMPRMASAPTADQSRLLENLRPGDKCRVTVYENLYSRRIDAADFAYECVRE